MSDLYDDLGVARGATTDEIRKAFRRKAKTLHPDAGGSVDAFQAAARAHAILISPERRAEYDRTGAVNDKAEDHGALSIISSMMDQLVAQVGDRVHVDIVAKMREAMDERLSEIANRSRQLTREIAKLERFAGKFERKGGNNLLRGMVLAKAANLRITLESAEKATADIVAAKEILRDYSFSPDPVVSTTLWGSGGSATGTAG